jgi:hypothetical protein
MWTFQALALVFYVLSIGIYPLCNTGWSSALWFLGSVASAGSVIMITQATGKDLRPTKSKQEKTATQDRMREQGPVLDTSSAAAISTSAIATPFRPKYALHLALSG